MESIDRTNKVQECSKEKLLMMSLVSYPVTQNWLRNWNAKPGIEYLKYSKSFLKRALQCVSSDFYNFRKRIFPQSGINALSHCGKNDILFKLQMINARKRSLLQYSRRQITKVMHLFSNLATEERQINGSLGTEEILKEKKKISKLMDKKQM